ncbi:MAG: serine hydrolase [Balneolaceae bacterium]|nr:serine hydrolase [Balneolaceae bacterium]
MKQKLILFLISASLFIYSCKTTEQPAETPDDPVVEEPTVTEPGDEYTEYEYEESDEIDIDEIIANMTLDEKIGQLFVVPAYGTFSNDRAPAIQRLERLVTNYHIGGIIFFRGDVYAQAVLNNRLQSISELPLWITQDMEFGAAMRVSGTTRFTPAMGIAATGNPDNAYLKGLITAREADALGVHQVFAPVLDVNNNPENPVINVRSYSADPQMVSDYALRFMEGVESVGVMATGKHFPGHGDTDTDSHLALPTINHTYERLEQIELVPFRSAVDGGIRSIMSAHIAFPNISANIGLPGTLDESILNSILVDTLGFDGLIVTDGLEMRGIADHYSPGEAVIMALLAGADVMLISPDEMTAINELKRAVESGRVTEERIEKSVRKILQLKKEHGIFEHRFSDVENLSSLINTPEYQATANRIARESITVLKNEGDVLPIREKDFQNIVVVAVSDGDGHSSESVLQQEMRRYHSGVRFHALNNRTTSTEINQLIRDSQRADLIVIGSFIMVRSHHPMQIPDRQLDVLKQLMEMNQPKVLTAFGNPYVVGDLPETDVHILAWASTADQVRQTIPSLFGASPVGGRFPGEVPGLYSIGDGLDIEQSTVRFDLPEASGMITDSLLHIDMIMQKAINDSVFPGGVVGVMKNGALVWQRGYGYHDYTKTRRVQATDVFDLASITKIMSTTTAIMKLADDGQISIDDPVAKYIEEFDTDDKRKITIRHFLLHTSGLPAFQIYVDVLRTRSEILNAVRNEPLENRPGERYVYSDLGFILLGEIVEAVSGKRVDQFVRDEIFEPMGLHSTWFNPEQAGPRVSNRILPTEIDTVYNRGTVHRRVHDERAYFMDGIAGHAGLFSSLQDISKYAYMLLNGGNYGGEQYLSPEIIDYFTGHRSSINHRGLGFDRKSEGFSSAGTLTGGNTFGHLGFTGTSLWVDPDEDIAIILLTNRTYPNRSYGSDIRFIRAAISDAVMNSIAK